MKRKLKKKNPILTNAKAVLNLAQSTRAREKVVLSNVDSVNKSVLSVAKGVNRNKKTIRVKLSDIDKKIKESKDRANEREKETKEGLDTLSSTVDGQSKAVEIIEKQSEKREIRLSKVEADTDPSVVRSVKVTNLKDIPKPVKTKDVIEIKKPSWWKDQSSKIIGAIETVRSDVFKVDLQDKDDPEEPVAVRLSDGKNFIDKLVQVVGGGGGQVRQPYTTSMSSGGKESRALVDSDGHQQVDIVSGGIVDPVGLKNVAGTTINPATEDSQLPDDHKVTVSNPTADPETGLATSTKQDTLIDQGKAYTTLIDDFTTVNKTYIGKAVAGASEGGTVWQIKCLDESGNFLKTQFADGVSTFTKEWDNRVGYAYS